MNNCIEISAKTVEEAVEKALKELSAKREDVKIEVLEEEKKGFLGISKKAKVKVTLVDKKECVTEEYKEESKELNEPVEQQVEVGNKEEDLSNINKVLDLIINNLADNVNYEIKEENKVIRVILSGEEAGRIVGSGGRTLEAIQYIVNLVAYNKFKISKKILIDTEEYRSKREGYLKELAKKTAEKVIKYKRSITLNPMNSYERMLVHSELQQYEEIKTYSIGEEPERKIVVALK